MRETALRSRTRTVLTELVREYIETAQPVGSETLVQKTGLNVSSATMRNEMAALEDAGYIARPHISSGAVPSDKGYRFYVESLEGEAGPLPEISVEVRRRFLLAERALGVWMQLAARALAEMVDTVAMVTVPAAAQCRLKRVELVLLRDFLALLIVVLQGARLLQQMLPLPKPVSQDELDAVGNKLSFLYAGLDRRKMGERRAELSPLEGRVKEDALAMMREADEEAFDPCTDGLRRLLKQPELAEGERVGVLMEVLEEKALLRRVLAEAAEQDQIQVVIGSENTQELLRPFSLVLCPYGLPGEATGVLGVLGPTRLAYVDAIGGVRFLSDVMTEMVSSI